MSDVQRRTATSKLRDAMWVLPLIALIAGGAWKVFIWLYPTEGAASTACAGAGGIAIGGNVSGSVMTITNSGSPRTQPGSSACSDVSAKP